MKDDGKPEQIKSIAKSLSGAFSTVFTDADSVGFISKFITPQVLENDDFKEWRKQLQNFERERFGAEAYLINRADMLKRFTELAKAVPRAKTVLLEDIKELEQVLPSEALLPEESIPIREDLRRQLLPFA